MIRAFQASTQALRFADVPVIVAPAGLTLGGGCEIMLHGDRVQAAAESYIGLVEVGVGLIPGGGGTKEMLARAVEDLPAQPSGSAAVRAAGLRNDRLRQGVHQRRRGAPPRLPRRSRSRDDESRTVDGRRQGARARARARRVSEAGAAHRDSGRRRVVAGGAQARHPPRLARRTDQRSRRGRRPRARQHPRRRRAAASDDRQRAVPARPRARGVPEAVRRAEDARAHPAHAENR